VPKVNRNFKGVWIPKEIWLDENVGWIEKAFLVEINSLDNDKGCFASNNYLSKFFGVSKGRCSQIITLLKDKGYIEVGYERNGKQITKRTIRVVKKLNRGYLVNDEGVVRKRLGGYLENAQDNNTISNNTTNKLNDDDLVKEKWNTFAKKHFLSPLISLVGNRKKHLSSRLTDKDFDFDKLLVCISKSSFLLGKTTDWKISFDWLVKSDNNYIKILEGNYNDKSKEQRSNGNNILTARKCSKCNYNLTTDGVCYTSNCPNFAKQKSSNILSEIINEHI